MTKRFKNYISQSFNFFNKHTQGNVGKLQATFNLGRVLTYFTFFVNIYSKSSIIAFEKTGYDSVRKKDSFIYIYMTWNDPHPSTMQTSYRNKYKKRKKWDNF